MHYKRLLTFIDGVSSYLSVGLDVGADFTWMSIALPNGSFVGKPFKIIHSDSRSRDLAVTKISTTRLTGNVVNLRSFIYKTTYDFIGFQHESFKYTHKKTTITKKVIVSSFISID